MKLFLIVEVEGDLVSSPFASRFNLFSSSKFNCLSRKESEKMKTSHFGQIQVQFEFCMISYCDSVKKEQSLLIHMSHLSH